MVLMVMLVQMEVLEVVRVVLLLEELQMFLYKEKTEGPESQIPEEAEEEQVP
jgi:hypothetical protein